MGARTIDWGRCTPLTIVDQFGIKISGFTPSYEALGRRRRRNIMMTKIRISHMSDFSCGETKVRKAFLWLAKGPLAISVGFWRSAGRFAASYKALFMHLT